MDFSVMVSPAWSVNWNGPPIAAGTATWRKPPITQSIRTSPTTRLPANAPTITSGRVRSIIQIPDLETCGEAGRDHLKENRRSIARPQHQRRDQNHGPEPRASRYHDALVRACERPK